MRVFKVIRNKEDGTKYEKGHLIDGIEFDDGTVVIKWRSNRSSVAIYQNYNDFYELHIGAHPEYNSKVVFVYSDRGALIR
ncbi:hypothetical protein LCGC14_1198390 [marine sediment metagenome]|uniref:Uncharacterized protein n=1 Tax=marine sediment metagenome TaxID=412755 RepID=A0A0F9LM37_9ZZZZ